LYSFSFYQNNIYLSFKIDKPFNPGEFDIPDTQLEAIFRALYANIYEEYVLVISEGYYSPQQMATELTNKMNFVVTEYVANYMKNDPETNIVDYEKFSITGYNQFVVKYNEVQQKIWFGNKSSGFVLANNSIIYSKDSPISQPFNCSSAVLKSSSNFGLPYNLGFFHCDVYSLEVATYPVFNLPRFTYIADAPLANPPTSSYWLVPDPQYKSDPIKFPTYVYTIEAPLKTNLLGSTDILMYIEGLNYLDETIPFQDNEFTQTTNVTNGVVNSAFAKIPITSEPPSILYNLYQESRFPTKIFNPPLERIRRLRIKFQFHNGLLVPFDYSSYSFVLEFSLFKPVIYRTLNYKEPTQPVIPNVLIT
jgi:hypothetical protein